LIFTSVRKDLEDFLVQHKSFINQLGHSKGGGTRSVDSIVAMHSIVLKKLNEARKAGKRVRKATLVKALTSDERLKDLRPGDLGSDQDDDPSKITGKKFSASAQAAAVIRDVLETRPLCAICGSRCPPNVRSKDHKKDQKLGGKGNVENLQFTHPYCNHSKDALRKMGVTS
jgi:5-methylcytosine-specific restriction endonuclease McrA